MNTWQNFDDSDFPLSISFLPEATVVFGKEEEASPAAWLGLSNGLIFIQTVNEDGSVLLNNKKLVASAWLTEGDEIQVDNVKITVKVENGVFLLTPDSKLAPPILTPPDTPPTIDDQKNDTVPTSTEDESSKEDSGENNQTHTEEDDFNEEDAKVDNQARTEKNDSEEPIIGALPKKEKRSRLRYIIIPVFILLVICLAFVLVAVPVEITIKPNPDWFSISRFPLSLKFGERYMVLPGEYHIVAEKKGYHKIEESIRIKNGSESNIVYEFNKLPGILDIIFSEAIDGAEVIIDGRVVGQTPLQGVELTAGRHELSIIAKRYLPVVQTIEIQGMEIKQSVNIRLQPGWGNLQIESKPNGAGIWLNGKMTGHTPFYIEPMAGAYQVKILKDGYKPSSANVNIEPGELVKMPLFVLAKADGLVKLTSKPSGASVMLNGEFRGHTPVSLSVISGMDHSLTLSKSGFVSKSKKIRVNGRKEKNVHIQLKPEYGTVFIVCYPANAELKIDGEKKGSASQMIKLTTVPHRIEVSKAGYESFQTTLTPTVSFSKKLDIQLKNLVQKAAEKIPAEIKTADGHILRRILLNQPAQFQMGASRREPGRRSNETQYMVELTRTFYISETEVTNGQFQKFRPGHNSGSTDGFNLNETDQPVTSVTWNDAAAYCNWISEKEGLSPVYISREGNLVTTTQIKTGYRLPTEAEWAYVARYEIGKSADGKPLRYPWGNKRYPEEKNGNYADTSAEGSFPVIIKGYNDGYRVAAPVGTFPPNKAGIFDLGGNVSEWCHDYYDMHTGGKTNVLRDPTGPMKGKYHVIRGASWRHGSITELRLSYREYSEQPNIDLGFRIVRYAEKENDK